MRRASSRAASRRCSAALWQASTACRAAVSATRTSSMAVAASDCFESLVRDMTRFTPSFGLADLTYEYEPLVAGLNKGLPQCSADGVCIGARLAGSRVGPRFSPCAPGHVE